MLVVVAPQSPKLVERFGKRTVVAAGMVFMAAGLAVLSRMDAGSSYALLLVGLVLMAGGIAAAMSPTTDLLMSAVPREHAGMGSAMNDTTRELGGSLGVAVFGSLLASRYVHELAPSLGGLADSARQHRAGLARRRARRRRPSRRDRRRRPRRCGPRRLDERILAVADDRHRDHRGCGSARLQRSARLRLPTRSSPRSSSTTSSSMPVRDQRTQCVDVDRLVAPHASRDHVGMAELSSSAETSPCRRPMRS